MNGTGLSGWRLELRRVSWPWSPASQLASALANWLSTLLATPQLLPRMDYSQGIATGIPDARRGSVAAQQRRQRRRAARRARSPVSRQPGPEPAFRPADRFLRCAARPSSPERRGRCSRGPGAESSSLNDEVSRSTAMSAVLPLPSAAHAGIRVRASLDGPRAQARQAGGPELPAARRRAGPLLAHRRRRRRLARRQLRHHARYRHPVAAGRRAAARRRRWRTR